MDVITYTAPAFWACYLINNDCSGMDDNEIKAGDSWIEGLRLGAPVDATDEPAFTSWHDAIDCYPFAADCLEYTFFIHE